VRGKTVPKDIVDHGLHAVILDSYATREERAVNTSQLPADSVHDRRR
jgi:hypothetical protein